MASLLTAFRHAAHRASRRNWDPLIRLRSALIFANAMLGLGIMITIYQVRRRFVRTPAGRALSSAV